MRLAVVSDVHGNLAALKAVEADLKAVSPDMVVHAGDSAVLGPRPAEVVDRLREIGWTGVVGNTDEMFWNASARSEQERRAPKLKAWLDVLFGDLCPWASERLGNDRIAWLRSQPREWMDDSVRVVHATSTDLWRAPMFDAGDQELHATYAGNGIELAIYGHIHRPFVRPLRGLTVANSGSVGLPWDGDPRASYLLVEEGQAIVRRVEYDLDRARRDSDDAGFPLAAWLDTVQREGRFSRPA
jgi:putative phosphoesterase